MVAGGVRSKAQWEEWCAEFDEKFAAEPWNKFDIDEVAACDRRHAAVTNRVAVMKMIVDALHSVFESQTKYSDPREWYDSLGPTTAAKNAEVFQIVIKSELTADFKDLAPGESYVFYVKDQFERTHSTLQQYVSKFKRGGFPSSKSNAGSDSGSKPASKPATKAAKSPAKPDKDESMPDPAKYVTFIDDSLGGEDAQDLRKEMSHTAFECAYRLRNRISIALKNKAITPTRCKTIGASVAKFEDETAKSTLGKGKLDEYRESMESKCRKLRLKLEYFELGRRLAESHRSKLDERLAELVKDLASPASRTPAKKAEKTRLTKVLSMMKAPDKFPENVAAVLKLAREAASDLGEESESGRKTKAARSSKAEPKDSDATSESSSSASASESGESSASESDESAKPKRKTKGAKAAAVEAKGAAKRTRRAAAEASEAIVSPVKRKRTKSTGSEPKSAKGASPSTPKPVQNETVAEESDASDHDDQEATSDESASARQPRKVARSVPNGKRASKRLSTVSSALGASKLPSTTPSHRVTLVEKLAGLVKEEVARALPQEVAKAQATSPAVDEGFMKEISERLLKIEEFIKAFAKYADYNHESE